MSQLKRFQKNEINLLAQAEVSGGGRDAGALGERRPGTQRHHPRPGWQGHRVEWRGRSVGSLVVGLSWVGVIGVLKFQDNSKSVTWCDQI